MCGPQYHNEEEEGRQEYSLQGPEPASPQKSTPLFLSICFDMPGGRG